MIRFLFFCFTVAGFCLGRDLIGGFTRPNFMEQDRPLHSSSSPSHVKLDQVELMTGMRTA